MSPKLATTPPDNGEKYRVILVNDGGIIKKLVVPSPVAIAATDIESTSFTANWERSFAAESYRLDVSESEEFTTFVSGYENRPVSGTSESVTGLTEDTTYYYRVRAEYLEDTFSNNSNVITVVKSEWQYYWEFDLDTSLFPENLNDTWFEMMFASGISGDFKVDAGDGQNYLYFEGFGTWSSFYYQIGEGEGNIDYAEGQYTQKIFHIPGFHYHSVETARQAVYLIYMWRVGVVGEVDISMFPNIEIFELYVASVSKVDYPETVSQWGMRFLFGKVETLDEIDLSSVVIPSLAYGNSGNQLYITNCPDLIEVKAPGGADYMNRFWVEDCENLETITIDKNLSIGGWFRIENCPELETLNITGGSENSMFVFRISGCPKVAIPDFAAKWPNLTNRSASHSWNSCRYEFYDNDLSASEVNKILADLDSISNDEYNNRRIDVGGTNAPPDDNSGGHDGLAAKASLEAKGFNVITS